MRILQMDQPGTAPPGDDGSWGSLVGWFSELVIRLDKGDLAGAVEAQTKIEEHGFKVTYRRRPGRRKGMAR